MVPPLPNRSRRDIVRWHHDLHLPVEEIAVLAGCCERTVYNILARHAETGIPDLLPRGRRPRVLNADDFVFIIHLLRLNPALFLDEVQDQLLVERDVDISLSSISRTLSRLGYSHKRLSKEAAECNELLRTTWQAAYGHLPMDAMVWLDESGVDDRDFHRLFGYAPEGLAAVRRKLFARGERTTMLPALTTDGIIAMHLFEGGVTTEHFIYFLQRQLVRPLLSRIPKNLLIQSQAPLLNPFRPHNPLPRSIVILDNCAIHHDEEIRRIIVDECGTLPVHPAYVLDCVSHSCLRCKAHLPPAILTGLQSDRAVFLLYQGLPPTERTSLQRSGS
jgi:transposase